MAAAARKRREIFIDPVSEKLGVRQDIHEVVPLVFARQYRVAQRGGSMSERGIDDPSLPFSRCPDGIAVPIEWILHPTVPFEVPNVPLLPFDTMAVDRTHDGDACV